jgi:asparagine synthase (glutamine-hydrolysing)
MTLLAPAKQTGDWLAVLCGSAEPGQAVRWGEQSGSGPAVAFLDAIPNGDRASFAETGLCRVFFDGVLHNRGDLVKALGAEADSAASVILRAYERWGAECLRRLRGTFALLVWDHERKSLLAARDPLGAHSLFYARGSEGQLFLSPSIDVLATRSRIRRTLNIPALADHLSHRWPDLHETFFEQVKRVPPGHRLLARSSVLSVDRYWDPAPPGRKVDWITEDELDRFDPLFDQAVARCCQPGRAGIFLSGGFDSISIAAVAADGARRSNGPAPVALSLAFPMPECNEETVQRGVANTLGLPHEVLSFDETVSPEGLLARSLQLTSTWPSPILNTWLPAYSRLASIGAQAGVAVILTGSGGDEWLSVSPYHSADLIRRGQLGRWLGFVAAWKQSYRVTWPQVLRGAVWTYGARPLSSLALGRIAPGPWARSRGARLMRKTPAWVAPGRDLRQALEARAERALTPTSPSQGFYVQEIRTGMDHPLMSMELEETFEFGRRLGLRVQHPYWDADLIELLYRTPPHLLNQGGRSKALVRRSVARRFPMLGFDRQKKVVATSFYRATLAREGGAAWRRLGGVQALADMEIVNPRATEEAFTAMLTGSKTHGVYRIWDILSTEAWVRARS